MRILIGMAAIGLALSAKSANTWWVDDDNYGLS